jgi:DNA modification methylase
MCPGLVGRFMADAGWSVVQGDCLDVLRTLPDASVDAVVTDPPAGIAFMGKKWDHDKGGRTAWIAWMAEIAAECLRVLKPGGHALVWALPRTSHWTATAWEDGGFEIRDRVAHVFGSGFPKSMDVSKAIDKAGGDSQDHLEARKALAREIREKREMSGVTRSDLALWFPQYSAVTANWERQDDGFRVPSEDAYSVLVSRLGVADNWRGMVRAEDLRRLESDNGQDRRNDGTVIGLGHSGREWSATTEAAKQWQGWGTALKPAMEDWWLCRKPLIGTVAENVLRHGVGGLNIDACRIPANDGVPLFGNGRREAVSSYADGLGCDGRTGEVSHAGRWPANLVYDGSDEVVALFPDSKGQQGDLKGHKNDRQPPNGCFGKMAPANDHQARGDSGSAVRFFQACPPDIEGDRLYYCPKASRADRNEGLDDPGPQFQHGATLRKIENTRTTGNGHPTVKPTSLMRYLCRLITPNGGLILDPFMGSGSTGKSAIMEGFRFIGIEQDAEYCEIARRRLAHAAANVGVQGDLGL